MMNTRFGEFGGQYIPEILMSEINHVAEAYETVCDEENKEKLKRLNAIIHPKVINFYKELKEKKTDKVIIFDVPLLFESGIDKFCDKILVVISDYEIQLNRIVERDKIDRELASKIIKSQLSNEERIKKADVVIENNSNLEDLFEKVERFCETI